MTRRDPTFWELVVEAFHRKPVVKGLGGVSWNKVALAAVAILGIGNPGFWLAGFAGELLYLYLSATNPRFRNLVRAKRLAAETVTVDEQTDRWIAELGPQGRARFQALRANCQQVQQVYETLRPGGLSVLDEQRWKGLDQLLFLFLRLQVSLELLERQLGNASPVELQREVEALRTEIAAPATSEALKRSRQSLLELKEKRLENLGRAAEARQILSSELQRVEQQVELLREEAAISRDAESLSTRIDSVAGILSENDAWMRQHEELLSGLGVEGSDVPRLLERAGEPARAPNRQ